MFKKLKDKIAEEVKQSPIRIQQIAQAAQAAVGSMPSSSNSTEVSGSDQFFSITEEDTPHNSPRNQANPDANGNPKTSNGMPNLNQGPSIASTRQRRMSNSSMASDVSFRLPAYDSPAVYHLQSDLECSASEFEDTSSTAATSAQLEMISKEQLHSAYKKALDRYQKYRNRYTEIAKRYRDLERDNNKARTVLVETQDKALRRISELREQCSLEQQAKAHLESALRLEMEEMQCVIGTMKTKLTLLGENPEATENYSENGHGIPDNVSAQLVDLSDSPVNTSELENKIKSLEQIIEVYKNRVSEEHQKHENRNKDVESLEFKVKQLNDNLNDSINKIKELQSREEENTILLAENKMMVHSELENKEEEVKKMKDRIQYLEQAESQFEALNNSLKEKINGLVAQITEFESYRHDKESKLNDMETNKIKLMEEISRIQSDLAKSEEKCNIQSKRLAELSIDNDERGSMAEELQDCQNRLQSQQQDLDSQCSKIIGLEQEISQLNESFSKAEKEVEKLRMQLESESASKLQLEELNTSQQANISNLQESNSMLIKQHAESLETVKQLTADLNTVKCDNQKLTEESKLNKAIKETTESEALQTLQSAMKQTVSEFECKVLRQDQTIVELNESINDLTTKLKAQENAATVEVRNSKSKIESLRNEKRDLEKTLEKEIRDKNELKVQVTNILKEIGRLEEHLNEVKASHSSLELEKQQLEERIDNLQNNELKLAHENEQMLQAKLKELQTIITDIQCENSQLSEKNCLLEENTGRLEAIYKQEKAVLNEEIRTLQSQLNDLENTKLTELESKLKESTLENSQLLNEKSVLEEKLISIQEMQVEQKSEQLLVLERNKSLQAEVLRAKEEIGSLTELTEKLNKEAIQFRSQSESQIKEVAQDCDNIKELLSSIQAEKCELETEIETLKKQLIEAEFQTKKVGEKATTEMERKLKDYEEVKVENEYLNTLVKQLELDLEKVKTESVKRDAMWRELKGKYDSMDNEVSNLQEHKSKFECVMADKDAELADLKEELRTTETTYSTKMDTLSSENKALKSEIAAKQIIITDLNQDLRKQDTDLKQAHSGLSTECEELKTANIELNDTIRRLEGDLKAQKELRKLLDTTSQQNNALQLRVNEMEVELQDTVTKHSQLSVEQLKKTSALDELTEENEMLKLKLTNLEKTLNTKLAQLEEKHGQLIDENRTLKEAQENGDDVDADVNKLVEDKRELELRLQKILADVQEVSNRNLFLEQKCENFLIMEQNNERLRSNNEKLQRQLDETLVTMQHNGDGIAANTEFEYLKNIMFQYLSGNINGNNTTLVKVISAVLKFNPQQTQVVLQKENQRHSLMGQINKLL